MNTAQENRTRVAAGTSTATSGMRRTGKGNLNRAVFGGDRWPRLWPCKRDHSLDRIKIRKDGSAYCNECQLEDKHPEWRV